MRKDYNVAWFKALGQLTSKERIALKNWASICNKIEKNKRLKQFTESFYHTKDSSLAFEKLRAFLDKEGLKKLKNIFQIFDKRFKRLWEKYVAMLRVNKNILENDFKNVRNNLNQDSTILSKIYGAENWSPRAQIYLIISPIINTQGGRSIGPNKIAVEFNKLYSKNTEQLEKCWNLILHELTHSLFENQEYKNWIKNYINNKKGLDFPVAKKLNLIEIIRECIVRCFLINLNENGLRNEKNIWSIVNEEYFNSKLKNKKLLGGVVFNSDFIKAFVAWKLDNLSKKYIAYQKRIDEKFLEAVFKLLKNYPNNLIEQKGGQ